MGVLYVLSLKLLLLQKPQLLLPLLTDPRDKRIEKPELLTLFIHLEVGVLKHNFKSVVCEDIREALQEKQNQFKCVPEWALIRKQLLHYKPTSHMRLLTLSTVQNFFRTGFQNFLIDSRFYFPPAKQILLIYLTLDW